MIRSTNPHKISLGVALILSVLLTAGFFIFYLFRDSDYLLYIVIAAVLLMGVIEYFVVNHVLKIYIFDRIKVIYKTIHRQKLRKEDKLENKEKLSGFNVDIIDKVNEQVEDWVKDHTEEIRELKKMENFRREFLGNVSHELKTPLFNLQGFIHTLIDGGISDPEINERYLLKSEKNIDRMITIMEDLDIISRLESGEYKANNTDFNILPLIKDVVEILEPKAAEKNISIFLADIHSNNVIVNADKENIRTVILNLVENAIKYGVVDGRIKISIYDMDENYLIEVSDNGVGIEEEHIPRLFERFYRVDKHRSRSNGGSGLGLAIVKHIIESHNQTINVRSTIGLGTTFSFTLSKAK
ncbi:MAG: sensor histidine kinase [Bacteroidales bacterium]|jgi:two-component system phosphate regulon sensor histidine kinase PhoR